MKQLLKRLNWKNLLQRTLLFFFVFLIIRILVDVVEHDFSFNRIVQQSLVRYFLFALILGMLDSETWFGKNQQNGKEQSPVVFKNFYAALIHYAGVAFFISILCGLILTVFFFMRWTISKASGNKTVSFFPDFGTYVIVIMAIGFCFAGYDAWKNYRKGKK